MAFAALGQYELLQRRFEMNERQRAHYKQWAEKYHGLVEQRVGYVDASVLHLWHGDLRNRGYRSRHPDFARYEFDPSRDIALADNGVWRWNSAKPEMHEYVRQYFASRREDG